MHYIFPSPLQMTPGVDNYNLRGKRTLADENLLSQQITCASL